MATLDARRPDRRRRRAPRACRRPGPRTARAPRGRPATTSSRARSRELSATGDARGGRDPRGRHALPRARRGDAAAAALRSRHDRGGVPRALHAQDRKALRGRVLGSAGGPGAFGLALGVAFQITDDILDCSGVTIETGKIAGTDLREGTPTLPLLLAAQRDEAVACGARRRAAARGSAAARRVDRRDRGEPRGRARLRARCARVPQRRAAPRGAGGADRRSRGPGAVDGPPGAHRRARRRSGRRSRPASGSTSRTASR